MDLPALLELALLLGAPGVVGVEGGFDIRGDFASGLVGLGVSGFLTLGSVGGRFWMKSITLNEDDVVNVGGCTGDVLFILS